MQLATGQLLVCGNRNTGQHFRLQVHELYDVHGQYMVYASALPHQVRVPSGPRSQVVDVPPRKSVFVVLTKETITTEMFLIEQLAGLPLAILDGQVFKLILNTDRGIWDRQGPDRDSMLYRGRRIIDLYVEYNRTGDIPGWFRAMKVAAAEKNGG
jgi:hypothetical protein|tara:strand:- start:182 stop:646 length:465 start_codon:yes stop_codon:yes gene_type:complete